MKKKFLIFLMVFSSQFSLKAQEDVHYNHIFSAATYYNPSFAGINGSSSFSYNFTDCDYERQNPGIYSFYLSADTYLDSIHAGVGLVGYYNKVMPNNGSAGYIGAIYAPKFRLTEKFNISPSIKPGYIHHREDLILSNDQAHYDTITEKKDGFDLSVGLLLNSKRFFVGFSVDHLLEPKINYRDNSLVSLKRKYNAQFGYHYAKNDTRASFIHFNLLCQYQDNSYAFFASNYYVGRKYRYSFMGEEFFHRIMIGAGYKLTNDPLLENGVFFGIGTQEKYLTLGVGFEISTSNSDLNAIETSLKFALDKK
jgi:type IX secretion system PorP/SprF family membrane protein